MPSKLIKTDVFNRALEDRDVRWVKTVVANEEKRDKHFPLFVHDNVFRRLFDNPHSFCSYVAEGQTAADLGCGPGFYSLGLAECVGPEGKVYAVDSDEKAIKALEKKADKRGYHNIETHVSSASDLSFMKDGSVNFVLANGLLCSMAPQYHEPTINEIRRILKPKGLAYLSAARGFYSYMNKAEWERILEEFKVERRGDGFSWIAERWAIVSTKPV
jgi:ubiquinone/menaquinone biosynthesis C-methylase UbiE